MRDWTATRARKAGHLRIALENDVDLDAPGVSAGFERFQFIPNALPEINLSDVDTGTTIFGRSLGAPVLISSMTGGTEQAGALNRVLARVAQRHRLAMGLGSGRVLLENHRLLPTFDVRAYAPDVLLFANLGAVQLNQGINIDDCRRLLEDLSADGLILHLNPLQEALEPDGDTTFAGLLPRIAALCAALKAPVVIKEVGFGLAPDVIRRLREVGVSGVDVAGAGGTAWTRIEAKRAREPWRAEICEDLADWGMPTAIALQRARAAAPFGLVFGSGGVRTGLDVAKAIALGADLVGIARPFLHVAAKGADGADQYARRLIEGLRVTMFAIGAATVGALRGTNRLSAMSRLNEAGLEGRTAVLMDDLSPYRSRRATGRLNERRYLNHDYSNIRHDCGPANGGGAACAGDKADQGQE